MVEKTEELWKQQEKKPQEGKKPEEGPPGKTPGELIRRMQLQLETEERKKDGARATRRMTLDVLQEPGEAGPSGSELDVPQRRGEAPPSGSKSKKIGSPFPPCAAQPFGGGSARLHSHPLRWGE